MYNSLVVGFLVKIWNIFVSLYEGSLIKKIIDGIKKVFAFMFKGSIVKDIFTKDNHIIEKSVFYRIYSWLAKIYEKIWTGINRYMKKSGKTSFVHKNISVLFKDDIKVIGTISMFIFFFCTGVIVRKFLDGYLLGRTTIISIILIIGSLVTISLKDNIKEILNSSYVYKFIESLFTIDEGGDQWW
ncbi:hypothetical protein ACTNDY_00410 [Tissierellaceae bacterium HCP3S3_D8]